jgi:hypothetical protein
MALLNTHTAVKKFVQHGFSEEQAEVMVEVINDQSNELATKADLFQVKTELKGEIAQVKTELTWIKATLLAILGLLVKLTFFN